MNCMGSEVEREQRRVDRLITRQLKEDKRSLKHELKLLLLGISHQNDGSNSIIIVRLIVVSYCRKYIV